MAEDVSIAGGSDRRRQRQRPADVPSAADGNDETGDMSALMDDMQLGQSQQQTHHCPVPGCRCHTDSQFHGWQSFLALRSHVDAHLLGELPGLPPTEWLAARNMRPCAHCGRLVSLRCNGGIHRTCMAQRSQASFSLAVPAGTVDVIG